MPCMPIRVRVVERYVCMYNYGGVVHTTKRLNDYDSDLILASGLIAH
jgi:hypothetical protein